MSRQDSHTLLFFDLLGISQLNAIDVERAANVLNQFALVLEAGTKDQEWEFGFHLSDSTFLVTQHTDRAFLWSIALWKHFFLHDVHKLSPIAVHPMDAIAESERWSVLECAPRGAIGCGDIRVVPGLRWFRKTGFRRLERREFIDMSDIITTKLTVRLGETFETQIIPHRDTDSTEIILPRATPMESILGFGAVDSSQESMFVHIGEIGNITGTAVVRAVKASEHSGLKGPRLIVDSSVPVPQEYRPYVARVPNSDLSELLWNADFAVPSNSLKYLYQALNLVQSVRNTLGVLKHYSALLSVTTHGVVASYAAQQNQDELQSSLRQFIQAARTLISTWDQAEKTTTPQEHIYSLLAAPIAFLARCGVSPEEAFCGRCPGNTTEWQERVADSLAPVPKG